MFAFKFCKECDSQIDCVDGTMCSYKWCSYKCKYDGMLLEDRPKKMIVVKFFAFHHEEAWDGKEE